MLFKPSPGVAVLFISNYKEVAMKETFNQCYNQPGVSGDGGVKGHAGYYFINLPMVVCLPLRSCISKKAGYSVVPKYPISCTQVEKSGSPPN